MSRIYKVTANGKESLINAGSRNAAARHIAQKMIVAEVASQADLVRLAAAGTKVEDAAVAVEE
jgi:hypothetical protein